MTVKDRVGRVRYVAFRLVEGAPLTRSALSGALPPEARLTRFDGENGIVRARHDQRDAIVAALSGLARAGGRAIRIETLVVSGTIRAAARALPADSPAAKRTRARR